MIRRINAEFVPIALKAGLVNGPPDDDEGSLYREIARSRIAPQGICVVNPAGKVLDWALMFDDDKSVLAFLDHVRKRYQDFPSDSKPVPAERYMKFPSQKLPDVEDNGVALQAPASHPAGAACPAKPMLPVGTLTAHLYGRALDKDGKPVADTASQEHYVEDAFQIPVVVQQNLAATAASGSTERFRLSEMGLLLVGHAYLGQLDVDPTGDVPGSQGKIKQCEFSGRVVDTGEAGLTRIQIEGTSEAAGVPGQGVGDGRLWEHEVKLTWQGMIELRGNHIVRLLATARGTEKLKWGHEGKALPKQADVSTLPAGHAIDQAGGVRYGVIAANP